MNIGAEMVLTNSFFNAESRQLKIIAGNKIYVTFGTCE